MAERIVNNGIKFAYVSETPQVELKKELEHYFLYQNILVIDKNFEFGKTVESLKESTKCNFIVARNLDECKDFDSVSCIISVNGCEIENIKEKAFKSKIPYMIVLTKICESSIFKNHTYASDFDVVECNYPFGIVFCLNYLHNLKLFECEAIMEISSLSFNILQKKLGNLFFSEEIEYENFVLEKKILIELQTIFEKRDCNEQSLAKVLAKLYISTMLLVAKDTLNLIDNLTFLHKFQSGNNNLIEIKNAYCLILTSLEKNFFLYYTSTFKDSVDIEKHQKELKNYHVKHTFFVPKTNENKTNFLLDEFREKLVDYVQTETAIQHFVKNTIAEIDVDFLFNMFSKLKGSNLTYNLSLEPNLFKSPNFLSIMFENGLLNYDL